MASAPCYDVLIAGGGPCGCTAALYAARSGLSVLLLERLVPGGQMGETSHVDNYPGFPDGVQGFQLAQQMWEQARRFGAELRSAGVTGAELAGPEKQLFTDQGPVRGRCVILAPGASPRKLGLSGERELTGRGVHYCAACDGMFYRDKTVAVVGGGNSAAEDALLLSRLCRQVILIHRRDTLRAEAVSVRALHSASNIEFRWNSVVTALTQDGGFTGVTLENRETGEITALPCDGLFVSVGRAPDTAPFQGQVPTDEGGYLLAGEDCQTGVPGVFAAGDARNKAVRQIVTAVSDGACAAHSALEYLSK